MARRHDPTCLCAVCGALKAYLTEDIRRILKDAMKANKLASGCGPIIALNAAVMLALDARQMDIFFEIMKIILADEAELRVRAAGEAGPHIAVMH